MMETTVDSFIIRIIQDPSPEPNSDHQAWHGVIRHVQSREQRRFTDITDALEFVANYVDLTGQSALINMTAKGE